MTIIVSGVEGSMTTVEFARLMKAAGDLQASHGVANGLVVTKTATARQFAIASGAALAPGALLESSAVVNVTGDANSGSNPRLDLVCAQVDWTGTETTAGSFVIVKGVEAVTPVLPALTQTAGVLWREPIYQYQMQGGVVTGLAPVGVDAAPPVWTALTLSNSWASIGPVPAVKVINGIAYLRGRLAGGTATDGFLMATLPADSRPVVDLVDIPAMRGTTTASAWKVTIRANGRIEPVALAANTSVSLNGISYPIS